MISIVMPAYNEEKRIGNTLEQYLSFFGNSAEIFVVLNGCRDGTISVVRELQERHSNLRYKDIYYNIGKGGAIIEGFNIADGDLISFVDADGATSPEEFNKLVRAVDDGCDGAIASRHCPGSRIGVEQPPLRRLGGRVFNFLVRLFFRLPYFDTQCGAKVFTKKAVKTVLPLLGVTNFAFDVDLLYLLRKYGFKVVERPTVWNDQEGSTVDIIVSSYWMIMSIIRLRAKYSFLGFLLK